DQLDDGGAFDGRVLHVAQRAGQRADHHLVDADNDCADHYDHGADDEQHDDYCYDHDDHRQHGAKRYVNGKLAAVEHEQHVDELRAGVIVIVVFDVEQQYPDREHQHDVVEHHDRGRAVE